MRVNIATVLLISIGFVFYACKKAAKTKSEVPSLGYAGKMVGKHQWRWTTYRPKVDSNGDTILVPEQHTEEDSILVFSSAKIAFTSSRYLDGARIAYDTLDSTGADISQNMLIFSWDASGKYYVTHEELKYNYIKDTLVRHIWQEVLPGFNPGADIYYYSP